MPLIFTRICINQNKRASLPHTSACTIIHTYTTHLEWGQRPLPQEQGGICRGTSAPCGLPAGSDDGGMVRGDTRVCF